jgi:hypothetical protein
MTTQAQQKQYGLIVGALVEMTTAIAIGISQLEEVFIQEKILGFVSSGKRSAEHQLQTIIDLAHKANIVGEFSFTVDDMTLTSTTSFGGKVALEWQVVWSRLMNLDFDVNPPIAAELLMDRFKGGVNKKGKVYPPTEHEFGLSFDVEGFFRGQQLLTTYTSTLVRAMQAGKIPAIVSYTMEATNNCLHINCKGEAIAVSPT